MIYIGIILVLAFIFLGALVYSLKPVLGISLFSLVLLACIIGYSLEFGLLMALFTIPFDRLFLIVRFGGITVSKVLIGITIIVWFARVSIKKDPSILNSFNDRSTSILALCYLTISIISCVNATNLDRSLVVLAARINVIVFYFLIINLVRSRKLLNRTIDTLLLASCFICLIGLYEFATGDQILPESVKREELLITSEGASRIQGCSGNPDFHAAILIMLLPFLLSRIQLTKERRSKITLWTLLVLYIVNILGTNARLGLLGMLVAFFFVFLLSGGRFKFLKLSAALTVLAIMFLGISVMPKKMTVERYTGESGLKSIEYRLGWILMSWEMVKKHPFLGVGTGNYFTQYNRYIRAAPEMVTRTPIKNHNGIMQIWAENGSMGLVVFLLLLFSIPFELFKRREGAVNKELRTLRVGITTSYLNYIICLGIIPALEHEFGWLVMGLAISLVDIRQNEFSESLQTPSMEMLAVRE
jgi:O-antigen ligase